MRLLIVDDEMQIRTGLEQGIDWSEYGFNEVYTARNGIEALELCNDLQPELIITDIRMPGIDGIELSRQVVNLYEMVEIIILSGYSEFEYAREALKLGAFDYLLKPINMDELIRQVTQAKKTLEEKRHNQQTHSAFQKLNREKILRQYLEGKKSVDAEKYLKEILHKDIVVAVFSVDIIWKGNLSQMLIYLNQYLQTLLKPYQGEILFSTKTDIVCFIEVFSPHEFERKVQKLSVALKELNKMTHNQFSNTVSVSLSLVNKGSYIPEQYGLCLELLKHRMYLGMEQLILERSVNVCKQLLISPIQTEELKKYIGSFDIGHIQRYLELKFQELQKQQIISVEFVKGICQELKNVLLSTIFEKGVDIESIFEHSRFILNDIPEYRTLEEYRDWINSIYYLILNGLSQLVGKSHSRVIVQAVDYISKNYTYNISLEEVAEYTNKSKNYFSYLFKKEMGISFIEYLNQVRIEQAKKLLQNTDELTYEISEKVGYSDYKYFSSVFKKLVGIPPAKYRKI